MGIGTMALHREQQIERADDVVVLGVDRIVPALQGVWCGRLLGIMDDGVGAKIRQHIVKEMVIEQVADEDLYISSGKLLPCSSPSMQGRYRQQRLDTLLEFPLPLREIVDDCNLVTSRRKMQGSRPPQVTVSAKNQNTHNVSLLHSYLVAVPRCSRPINPVA